MSPSDKFLALGLVFSIVALVAIAILDPLPVSEADRADDYYDDDRWW